MELYQTENAAEASREAQDKVLRLYFAQKYARKPEWEGKEGHATRVQDREHLGSPLSDYCRHCDTGGHHTTVDTEYLFVTLRHYVCV
jgi:hypothetical protein